MIHFSSSCGKGVNKFILSDTQDHVTFPFLKDSIVSQQKGGDTQTCSAIRQLTPAQHPDNEGPPEASVAR